MKALILTYDERAYLAELTIKSYMKFWPNSGLTFRVPYNVNKPDWADRYDNIEFVQCGKHIKPSIQGLFKGIPDQEWIYWCFDDCYLHDILDYDALNGVKNYIECNSNHSMDAFRLIKFHDEKQKDENILTFGGIKFAPKPWHPYRFWFHQFVRAGIMKNAFLDNNLPDTAKIAHIEQRRTTNPKGKHNVYIPNKDVCVLGETSRGGMLTQNCLRVLEEYGVEYKEEKTSRVQGFILNGADVNNSGISSSVRNKSYLKRYL